MVAAVSALTARADEVERDLEATKVQVKNIRDSLNNLSTAEIQEKLSQTEEKIQKLSDQIDSLQQVISPKNASDILTVARWTLNFLATPEIVPTPNSYSRLISSNSSTLFLLFIEETSLDQILSKESPHPKGSGGPNQGAEMGQIRVPKSEHP
jgi:hypothetical protein